MTAGQSSGPVVVPEAVEAAARARHEYLNGEGSWDRAAEHIRTRTREAMTLALAAAVPVLHEAWAAPLRAEIAAKVLGPVREFDMVGGSLWLDRAQWGVVLDGLVAQRAEALSRKAVNPQSNSDVRADMCADLIRRIYDASSAPVQAAEEVGGDE